MRKSAAVIDYPQAPLSTFENAVTQVHKQVSVIKFYSLEAAREVLEILVMLIDKRLGADEITCIRKRIEKNNPRLWERVLICLVCEYSNMDAQLILSELTSSSITLDMSPARHFLGYVVHLVTEKGEKFALIPGWQMVSWEGEDVSNIRLITYNS
jgi:hypothetical protein